MGTTIFCTFEQQDLADLAVGKLRAETTGIKSIHYIGGFKRPQTPEAVQNGYGFFGLIDSAGVPTPSVPVTVKIVCSDSASASVRSKLVNLRAYKIITVR